MPIYEFVCPPCDRRFEELVAAGSGMPPCPSCGGAAERVVSSFSTAGVGRKRADFSGVPFEHQSHGACGHQHHRAR